MQYAYFNELPPKTIFTRNGNLCQKRSTRTADIDTETYSNLWFYFNQRDLCVVGNYSRLDVDYFSK